MLSEADNEAAAQLLSLVAELAAELRPHAPAPTVRLDSRLDRDLGLDSLGTIELAARLERRFGVLLPEQVVAAAETPLDLLSGLRPGDARGPDGTERPAPAFSVPAGQAPAPASATSLVAVLDWHVQAQPDRVHVRVLGEAGAAEELTYAELHREAAAVAAGLLALRVPPGASVAIMLPTGRDYFAAFAGVLLAGAVPVPVYPPSRPSRLEEHLLRQAGILGNARAVALVTVPEARRLARLVAARVPSLRHIATVDELRGAAGAALPAAPPSGATALVQYTSGSTGDPKGVVLTHAHLLANIRAMEQAAMLRPSDVFVSWLPLYHDMGLIGAWLTSLYVGMPLVVMSPLAFLTRPARWLQAVHDHRGTISGGPNFGFDLAARRVDAADLEGLDLSSWRIAFSGAEPVTAGTLERFVGRLAPHGLRAEAILPVYGLAEVAVCLTMPPLDRGARLDHVGRGELARSGRAVPVPEGSPDAAALVACGPPLPGYEVRVVDPSGATVQERTEGRIRFRGPSATSGYLHNPAATAQLRVDGWLESGDLGYLDGGELFVTGRTKDVIIRAGRNLHPAELEEAVARIPGIRKGCVAVFAARGDGGTERLVVVAETRLGEDAERLRMRQAVDEAAVELLGGPPDDVVLARPGTIPKTSSGKLRRGALRERYEQGALEAAPRPAWWQVARLVFTSRGAQVRRGLGAAPRWVHRGLQWTVFGVVALPGWLLVVTLPRRAWRWTVVRGVGRLLLGLAGVRLTVEGSERLPPPPFVAAANHASNLDPLVLALAIPGSCVYAAHRGLGELRPVRAFLRRLDTHILRGGADGDGISDTGALTEVARAGTAVVLFPEGHRSTSPGLQPFRMGTFLVAANAGVPVVPVALRGTRHVLPVGSVTTRRGPVTVTIGAPVLADQGGWAGAVELHNAARAAILSDCGEPDASEAPDGP